MLKQRHFTFAAATLASAVAFGCGLASGDDDDDATPSSGGGPMGFGGGVNFGGAPVTNGGTSVSFGGSTTSAGGSVSTPGKFDGGKVSITQGDRDAIKGASCAGFLTEPETLPAVLELVIDVSSSMNQRAPNPDRSVTASKWEVTRDALLEAIPGVDGPGLAPTLAVGMLFYPNLEYRVSRTPVPVDTCVNTAAMVPIATLGPKGAAHRMTIEAGIAGVQLQLSTPTHDAYRYAFRHGMEESDAPGQRFMLLITDGTPTLSAVPDSELGCYNEGGQLSDQNPNPIVQEVKNVADKGVKTFLIGSPGSEANRTWMSTAAVLGGTAEPGCNINGPNFCHMDMTTAPDFAASLRAGLAKVVGQITPCTFTFAEPPPGEEIDPNKINVIITSGGQSSLIVRDDIGDCTEGWQLTADRELLLCPDTCTALKADAFAQADVVFGCASTDVPPR